MATFFVLDFQECRATPKMFTDVWEILLSRSLSDINADVFDYSVDKVGWSNRKEIKFGFILDNPNGIRMINECESEDEDESSMQPYGHYSSECLAYYGDLVAYLEDKSSGSQTWAVFRNPDYHEGCPSCGNGCSGEFKIYIVDNFDDIKRMVYTDQEVAAIFTNKFKFPHNPDLLDVIHHCYDNGIRIHKCFDIDIANAAMIFASGRRHKNCVKNAEMADLSRISKDIVLYEIICKWLDIADMINCRLVCRDFYECVNVSIKKYMLANDVELITKGDYVATYNRIKCLMRTIHVDGRVVLRHLQGIDCDYLLIFVDGFCNYDCYLNTQMISNRPDEKIKFTSDTNIVSCAATYRNGTLRLYCGHQVLTYDLPLNIRIHH